MIKKIAVLTSGGDAPGMNAAIRAVVRAGLSEGLKIYGVYDDYHDLYHNKIKQLTRYSVSDIINRNSSASVMSAPVRSFFVRPVETFFAVCATASPDIFLPDLPAGVFFSTGLRFSADVFVFSTFGSSSVMSFFFAICFVNIYDSFMLFAGG